MFQFYLLLISLSLVWESKVLLGFSVLLWRLYPLENLHVTKISLDSFTKSITLCLRWEKKNETHPACNTSLSSVLKVSRGKSHCFCQHLCFLKKPQVVRYTYSITKGEPKEFSFSSQRNSHLLFSLFLETEGDILLTHHGKMALWYKEKLSTYCRVSGKVGGKISNYTFTTWVLVRDITDSEHLMDRFKIKLTRTHILAVPQSCKSFLVYFIDTQYKILLWHFIHLYYVPIHPFTPSFPQSHLPILSLPN